MIEYKATPISRKNIEKIVYKIKRALGLEHALYFPIVKFLENVMPLIDNEFHVEIIDKKYMPGKYAETIPSQHKIRIREDVYNDACDDKHMARFTLCHEVGHYFTHDETTVTLCRLADDEKVPTYQNPEWQANTFAGYLLMTPNLIKDMSLEEVCEKCKVSKKAAKIQMKYL